MPKWKRTCKDDMVTWFGFYNGLELFSSATAGYAERTTCVAVDKMVYMSHVGQRKSHKEGRLDVMG